jgi:CheY-like chemotaxis protein
MPETPKPPPEEDAEAFAPSLDGVARRIEKLSLAVAEQTERLLAKSDRTRESEGGDLEAILEAARRSSELARELVGLARRERDAAAAALLNMTTPVAPPNTTPEAAAPPNTIAQPPSSEPPRESVPAVSERRVRAEAGPMVVLLVDDEPLLLKTMARMIEEYGVHVLPASSSAEALAIAAEREIDLVVADLLLPGTSGSELVKALRASRPDLRVLYMSGWDPVSSGVSVSSDRREAFLSKPFSAAELDACLSELIGTPRRRFADRR